MPEQKNHEETLKLLQTDKVPMIIKKVNQICDKIPT